ncbi:olfactory receptor 6N1-like [Sphaerodactylus townsendi]|uniref:olfactory receptor 6N1-like n=1 Tax=Sphaerodactylus townsendi TaxID=933632 RepID=UPI0020273C3E|nr:olfactory receptor 6N1-like [Sphaerodactylus townsendi]
MKTMETANETTIATFLLLGFGDAPELQIPLFLVFLIIYSVTMTGNIIIIVLVILDHHLHIPMYFFLGNLSCLETFYTSAILPRMLASFLTGDRTISLGGCFIQLYCFTALAIAECYLLASMSYDRYLAICKPLQYATLMSGRLCFVMSAVSWLWGITVMTLLVSLMSQLEYRGPHEIDQFFCDHTTMLNVSCSDTTLVTLVGLTVCFIDGVPPCLLTLLSYVRIIGAIVRIPSSDGRKKAFATCSSHITVVSIFYGSLIFVYLLPKKEALKEVDKIFSVFYTVLTPLINPLIYSLRNKEVKNALRRLVNKCGISKKFVRDRQGLRSKHHEPTMATIHKDSSRPFDQVTNLHEMLHL